MKRLRCCGRFCFWQVPLGPWRCTVCNLAKWGHDIPKSHRVRFWQTIESLVADLERRQRDPTTRRRDAELLALFK